jgi:DNA-binding NarL/FixJ family response regulator
MQTEGTLTKAFQILIVDDHPVVRQGLVRLIAQEPDLTVCAEAENAQQTLEILDKMPVDLAIVDISLAGTNGLQLTEKIKSRHAHLPVLILTMHDELHYTKSAFRAGARGYVTKKEAPETIITAIRLVLGGKHYLSEKLAQQFIEKDIKTDSNP